MDEQTKQALSAFVQKAIEATEKAGDFAVEQAPLVVQEYITRGLVDAAIGAGAALVGLVVCVCVYKWGARLYARDPYDFDSKSAGGALVIASLVASVVLLAFVLVNAHTALMIYVAPRVYIIEQLKGLL